MKVIKHLRHDTPEYRLKVFFRDIPLITRVFLLAISVCCLLLAFLDAQSRHFTYYSFFDARPLPEVQYL